MVFILCIFLNFRAHQRLGYQQFVKVKRLLLRKINLSYMILMLFHLLTGSQIVSCKSVTQHAVAGHSLLRETTQPSPSVADPQDLLAVP
jgi:hypothetical protein